MKGNVLLSKVNRVSGEIDQEFLRGLVDAIHSQNEVRYNIVDNSQPRGHPNVVTKPNCAVGLASTAQAIAVHSCRETLRTGQERNAKIIE
jgi:hypothetical protein